MCHVIPDDEWSTLQDTAFEDRSDTFLTEGKFVVFAKERPSVAELNDDLQRLERLGYRMWRMVPTRDPAIGTILWYWHQLRTGEDDTDEGLRGSPVPRRDPPPHLSESAAASPDPEKSADKND